MRRHYESLNYMDGQPNVALFMFSRTQGSDSGHIINAGSSLLLSRFEKAMTRAEVRNLRDMLTEVLEDWQ